MNGHGRIPIRAALLASAAALLPGCPGGGTNGVPTLGWRADRWKRYYTTGTVAGRQPGASEVRTDAWRVPEGVRARAWKYVVLHHSATDEGSAATFDEYHREVKGWKGLAYHFVIGNGTGTPDGAVEVGYRWERQIAGAHAGAKEYNQHGIGICLVGDFEAARPTRRQIDSLQRLLASLMKRFDIPPLNVVRHSDVTRTKCPGDNFPWPVYVPAASP